MQGASRTQLLGSCQILGDMEVIALGDALIHSLVLQEREIIFVILAHRFRLIRTPRSQFSVLFYPHPHFQ
jgi:hypothetical protein